MADTDELWMPDSREVAYLEKFGSREDAIIAIGAVADVTPWKIGRAAGLSEGVTTEEAQRRANLSSAVSKRTSKGGVVHPRIRSLQEHLKYYREYGERPLPRVAPLDEVLESATAALRKETGASRDKARDILFAFWTKVEPGSGKKPTTPEDVVRNLVARIGVAKARIALGAQAPGFLAILDEIEVSDADRRSGGGALEASGAGDFAQRGFGGDGDESATEVGSADASGVDRRGSRDATRAFDSRIVELERRTEGRL